LLEVPEHNRTGLLTCAMVRIPFPEHGSSGLTFRTIPAAAKQDAARRAYSCGAVADFHRLPEHPAALRLWVAPRAWMRSRQDEVPVYFKPLASAERFSSASFVMPARSHIRNWSVDQKF